MNVPFKLAHKAQLRIAIPETVNSYFRSAAGHCGQCPAAVYCVPPVFSSGGGNTNGSGDSGPVNGIPISGSGSIGIVIMMVSTPSRNATSRRATSFFHALISLGK